MTAWGEYDLLLGRKTYEIFAPHWSRSDDDLGRTFTAVAKYVAAGPDTPLTWNNSHRLEGDAVAAVARLKAKGDRDLLLQGSGRLIQGLLKADLIDEITTLSRRAGQRQAVVRTGRPCPGLDPDPDTPVAVRRCRQPLPEGGAG